MKIDNVELEERSRVARRSRNQLARTLRIESAKECKRNLMHKYTTRAEGRSGLLPTITGENGSFHRDLVWVGVLLQIVFVLAMWCLHMFKLAVSFAPSIMILYIQT
ncbi:hypothetical protein BDR04DRAFT_1087712 [Suillus decipiens]|nr:hypothetical protein BDR04DRAFT_1087712 [Suillus decipiens]